MFKSHLTGVRYILTCVWISVSFAPAVAVHAQSPDPVNPTNPVFPGVEAQLETQPKLDELCFATLNQPLPGNRAEQTCETALAAIAQGNSSFDASTNETRNGGFPGVSPPVSARVREARLHSALAMLRAARNDLSGARARMNQALALAADDYVVRSNQGNLLLREGAFRGAVDAYNSVLSQLLAEESDASLQTPLYLNRSLALRALGRYDEAHKDYQLYLVLTGVETSAAELTPPAEAPVEPTRPDYST